MAADEIHLGDIGLVLKATIQDGDSIVDLSAATTKEIKLKPPKGGATKTFSAAFFTDGTDGIITYTTVDADDLDVLGDWKIQGRVVIAAGDFNSDTAAFEVHKNL